MSPNRRVKDNARYSAIRTSGIGQGGVGYSVAAGGGSIFPVDFSVDTRTARMALRSRYTPKRRSPVLYPLAGDRRTTTADRRPPENS